jgi:type I restriction enzyme S subunit
MKLETVFEKFDQFADAPDAVAKMRELVLELAVQGRLTSALPSDGAVPSIFEFRESSAALANSLGLRSPKESVEEAEPPFDVPSHWRWMALADIGAAQTGTTPSKADHDAFNGDVPFIKPADILPNSIDYSNESLTRHGAESGSRLAPRGSLLMVCIGTIGKCNLIERECAFNQQINSLTPVDSVDSRYLLVAARSRSFQDAAWKKSSSTTIAILNKGKWLSIPVPLPPLAEQKRIVAKVDELMALCDRLEVQQQEREARHAALARASLARFADAPTPASLNFLFHNSYTIPPADLRKSILTLAVQGKLVLQDPNDEPAEELIGRIESTKEQLIKQRTIKRVAVEANPSGDACEPLPHGWLWTRLGNSFDVRDGTHDTPKYTTEGFPLITSKNIYSGSLSFDGANLISERDHRQISERSRVDRGDILFAMIGSIGNPVIVDTDREFSIKNVALFKYYTAADSEPRFLLLYLKLVAEEMKAKAAGGVQSFVSLGFLRNYLFPLPPLAEQRRIVAKVDQLMALVDELETQLVASRATAANLLSALVAELTNPMPNNSSRHREAA